MNFKPLILSGVITMCSHLSEAQNSPTSTSAIRPATPSGSVSNESNKSDFSAIKPIDGVPFVFSSEKDQKEAIVKKREALIEEIKNSEKDPEKIRVLREDLWRLDNSIVKSN